MQFLKVFSWGMLISFLGSLPLGTMNVTATNISAQQGSYPATLFALGSLVVETICVCIVLIAMNWARKQQKIFRVFEWLTALLILILSLGSFVAAINMKGFSNNIFTAYHIHPFLLGILLSALNPLHIPFWFGWSTVLLNKKILLAQSKSYTVYVSGISAGTILGFDVFIYGGNLIVQQLRDKQEILNWTIGIVLFITAIIQFYKILNKPVIVARERGV